MEHINTVTLQGTLKFDIKIWPTGPAKPVIITSNKGLNHTAEVWGNLIDELQGLRAGTEIKVIGRLKRSERKPIIIVKNKKGVDENLWETVVNVDSSSGGAITVLNAPTVAVDDEDTDRMPF